MVCGGRPDRPQRSSVQRSSIDLARSSCHTLTSLYVLHPDDVIVLSLGACLISHFDVHYVI
jgi:hypothetical protein